VARSVLYMSMSVDGFIAGPDDRPGNPGGDGFMRLHDWFGDFSRPPGPVGEMLDEMHDYGAIVAGRRTVEQIDHWGGDRNGVRIFVPSHRPADPEVSRYPLVTYVTDGIESAMAQAKAAAGDRQVFVHGAYTARTALESGVLDELQIHLVPVLFGAGKKMFDILPSRIELDVVQVIDTPAATHLRYAVVRPAAERVVLAAATTDNDHQEEERRS